MRDREIGSLTGVVESVRGVIGRAASNKAFNEQNTKASLIVPVLQALGWNTSEPDEVHWEYRRKPKSDPVDFALLLQRTPCLFLEAKALRESLDDHRMVKQVLGYAVEAGVQWVVLTNGDSYRIYNAIAPVPAEEKVFRTITMSKDPPELVASTLSLLSKGNLQDKKISRLWDSHFVDRQVQTAIEELLRPDAPSDLMVSAVRKVTGGRVSTDDIKASLRRVRVRLDFPVERDDAPRPTAARRPSRRPARNVGSVPARRAQSPRAAKNPEALAVSVQDLLAAGVLRAPVELFSRYLGHELRATIEADGSILYNGESYASPSMAGGAARKPFHSGKLKPGELPATNGWVFWKVRDLATGQEVELGRLRERVGRLR